MLPGDAEAVKDAKLSRSSLRRVWAFARPYRTILIVFLLAIVAAALLALVPPLAIRAILDHAIPDKTKGAIVALAGWVVGAALFDAALAIVQRWCSARIGEGLIHDLRVALFAKVQRMPVAFFTRTQTGALTSSVPIRFLGSVA